MLFDTHSHVQFKAFDDDRDEVILRCENEGVMLNTVGTQKSTSQAAVDLAEKYEHVYASVGLHPIQKYVIPVKEEDTSFTARGEVFDFDFYDKLVSSSKKVIAIGETGLDKFHIPKDITEEEVFSHQKETFLQHYKLALKHDLPLVIHVRDAHEEMIELLQTLSSPIKGTIHCFSGNWGHAQQYLDMGLHLGFTGIITFPAKKTTPKPQLELLEVVKNIPEDNILIETDAPYLAPQAYRGKRCEPWMVAECAKKIAEVKGLSYKEVEEQTTNNAKKLFGI